MKIKSLTLKNFRSYKKETKIDFDNKLTCFVGRNDIGKSTILEALDIFFNKGKGVVKIDQDDFSKGVDPKTGGPMEISIEFEGAPGQLIIDSTVKTSLHEEYLLNRNGNLEVKKQYDEKGKEKEVLLFADYPQIEELDNKKPIELKITELRKITETHSIDCNKSISSELRKAIYQHFKDVEKLTTSEVWISIKSEGPGKEIFEQLEQNFPQFNLFQSDRKNSDADAEVQDPLKSAVKRILEDATIQQQLDVVKDEVEKKIKEVIDSTLNHLKNINKDLAENLRQPVDDFNSLKWADVFKGISIIDEDGVPIRKRGSGVRRLVLLSFFSAEAERLAKEKNTQTIIYAFEEPETSQHFDYQRVLMDSLKKISQTPNAQIILTTHSSHIVKSLDFDNLLLIDRDLSSGEKIVLRVTKAALPFPSLNEVNYSAFGEISEEYHNELYGYLELKDEIAKFSDGKKDFLYIEDKKGKLSNRQYIKTIIIRHQIHHPENTHNSRFTQNELKQSIDEMRQHIIDNKI